jgi:hypothetical protein
MKMVTAKRSTAPRRGYLQELEPESHSSIPVSSRPSTLLMFSQPQVMAQLV